MEILFLLKNKNLFDNKKDFFYIYDLNFWLNIIIAIIFLI